MDLKELDLKEAVAHLRSRMNDAPERMEARAGRILLNFAYLAAQYMDENHPVGDIGWTLRREKMLKEAREAGLIHDPR